MNAYKLKLVLTFEIGYILSKLENLSIRLTLYAHYVSLLPSNVHDLQNASRNRKNQ